MLLTAIDFDEAVNLLESVLGPAPVGFAVIDRSYRYVRVNRRLAALNGLDPLDNQGRTLAEVLGESLWVKIKPLVDRVLCGETIRDIEFTTPSPSDPNVTLSVRRTYVPLRLGGEIMGVVSLARDTTGRTEAEQALERSELRFQQLVDTAEEGIWIVDSDHRTIFVNPQMARMLGYTVDEMIGTSVYDYLDGDAQRIAARYMTRRRDGERDKREFRFRRKDGADKWMLIATTGMPLPSGKCFGTVGLFTDVTNRKHSEIERENILAKERAARADAERVRNQVVTTLESIHDGFVSFDSEWRYSYVNRRAAQMLQLPASALIGRNAWVVSPNSVGRPFHFACLRAMREQTPLEIEELQDLDGRWFAYQLFPSNDGLSVFFHEITERKRIEAEKAELLKQVEAAADQQRTFLSDMLSAVTDKRLVLCWHPESLPKPVERRVWNRMPLTPNDLPLLRDVLRLEGEHREFEQSRIQDMIIGSSEAAMNCIVHGGGGAAEVRSNGTGPIQVWLRDTGNGIAMDQMPRAVLERGYTTAGSMGHGWKMILQTVDRIWLLTGHQGTTVVLEQDPVAPVQSFL